MKVKYLFLIISLLFANNSFAQSPKVPYKDVGACPFECCLYRQWTANKNITLYKQMSEKSAIAFRIKRREKVTGMTGVVITSEAGTVKALKDFTFPESKTPIKAGEIFYILTYYGEGYYQVFYNGKYFMEEVFDQDHMKVLSNPKTVWWAKIKNRKGQIGWTKLPENFDNKDSCS